MQKFTWCRSTGGYRWATKGERRVLEQEYSKLSDEWFEGNVTTVAIPESRDVGWGPMTYEWANYHPYEVNPPLFRQFADLADADGEVAPDRALDFARRHGHLTLHCRVSAELRPEHADGPANRVKFATTMAKSASPYWENAGHRQCGVPERAEEYRPVLDASNQGMSLGETFDLWQRNVREMSKLVALYDGLPQSTTPRHDRDILEAYIGEELDGRVLFAIDWQGGHADRDATGHLALRPRDLLGFIWLQFARHVSGAEEFRRCPACGEYFSLRRDELTSNQKSGPKRRRKPYAHAKYCTEYCRKKFRYLTVVKPARVKAKLKPKPKPGSKTPSKVRRRK